MKFKILVVLCFTFFTSLAGDAERNDVSDETLCTTNAVLADSTESGTWAFFSNLMDTSAWPARWYCGQWTSFHGWMYILSDLTIWFSYFMIPLILGYFVYKKKKERIP